MKLAKSYEPNQYEQDIYALWEQSNAFAPSAKGKGSYSIVMPPPNANGNLHLGHAYSYQIEDAVIRYQRMLGKSVLLLPGADHAGFETWVVYEKELEKQGKTRFDFGREELYAQVWDFVQLNKDNFEGQLRRLGISCDWSRFTFTLDDKVVDRAYKTFKQMWDDKLIYRGERLVNYCTHHGTSFSDIEVQYKEVEGHLWTISYPLTSKEGEITVATTRPETMLGDTAIAVNPKDTRYRAFIGKTVHVPLTKREIPIIADNMVDPKFGTGAVKVTPAHDPNDFEVGVRHDLPRINVIDHEGNITNEMPSAYKGKNFIEARELIVNDLKDAGLLVKTEAYKHSVGHCYKCDNVIQPLIRDQWFVNMKPLATKAIKTLQSNQIKFYPANKQKVLITYLKNLRDWNLSRQIAWGIPIPAFQNVDEPDDWIFDNRVKEEIITVDGKTYHRDPDVFDTWFSSGQWPFVTLNYPDGDDYKKYYPTSLMETGYDILYQWVGRMIMLGLYITDEMPFKEVYLNGLVQDEHGAKMSKSKGNVINPMDTVNEFGSDALRMGIIAGRSEGVNQPFSKPKVIAARNFCNKLWNIARFTEGILGDDFKYNASPKPIDMADQWVLCKLQQSIDSISVDLDSYRFSEAYNKLYHFVWDDVADWYIEASKIHPNKPMLAFVLTSILKLTHPFAPFVTETIWQTLSWVESDILINQNWPKSLHFDKKQASDFSEVQNIVSEIRYITKALEVKFPSLYFKKQSFLRNNTALIKRLAYLNRCDEVESGRGMHLTKTKIDCWLDIDLNTANKYVTKLRVNKLEKQAVIERLQKRLDNKAYTSKAPTEVVKQTKEQLTEEQELLIKLEQELSSFESATQGM
ncbi:MAG: valine--tRNA ligase [Candidatus Saccharibacteria bacterium]